MCGRFYIEVDKSKLDEIVSEVEANLPDDEDIISIKMEGEIFPTNIVPVQTAEGIRAMRWGFPMSRKDVINARSETVMEKPMFRTAMLERRCLVIATGYYEWKTEPIGPKTKYEFFSQGSDLIHIAGCFRRDKEAPGLAFVLLTRDATPEFAPIHHRMPVVLDDAQAREWLSADADISRLIAESVTNLEHQPTTVRRV